MRDWAGQVIRWIGYLLTPECQPEHGEPVAAAWRGERAGKRWPGCLKAAVWIFLSILLSLVLGQLR